MNMQNFGIWFVIAYVCVVIGVAIYILALLSRFVKAHERIAGALETTVNNLRRDPK